MSLTTRTIGAGRLLAALVALSIPANTAVAQHDGSVIAYDQFYPNLGYSCNQTAHTAGTLACAGATRGFASAR